MAATATQPNVLPLGFKGNKDIAIFRECLRKSGKDPAPQTPPATLHPDQGHHHLCYRIDKAATQLLGAKVRAGPERDAT